MFFPKQSLIDFLTVFYNLLDIGFAEKKALQITDSYFKKDVSYYDVIMRHVNQGGSIIQAVNNYVVGYSDFIYMVDKISLKFWLKFKIQELTEKRETYNLIFQMSLKPLLLMGVSILLNAFIFISLIPKINLMLVQFSTPIPVWFDFITKVSIVFYEYKVTFLIIFCTLPLLFWKFIKNGIDYLFRPIRLELMIKEVLEIIRSLHIQGMELKEIVSFIVIKDSSFYRSRFETFKQLILIEHSYQDAFKSLLHNANHELIINHGISAHKMEGALTQVIYYYQQRFIIFMKRVSVSFNVGILVITAIIIVGGFYLTLQPLMQLIQYAL